MARQSGHAIAVRRNWSVDLRMYAAGPSAGMRGGAETVLQFSTMYVLGIDAGGTKTMCLLADGDGRIIGEARGGGANLQASGEFEVEKVLHQVMDAAIGDRDVRP